MILGLTAGLLMLAGCDSGRSLPTIELQGPAMGSRYAVTVVQPPAGLTAASLRSDIDAILARITGRFSTYQPDSELSRLNRTPARGWTDVSDELRTVIDAGLDISRRSAGAFDVTVGPLVDVWGFGPRFREDHLPTARQIQLVRERVGYAHLRTRAQPAAVYRTRPGIEIDLNGIVPGYVADLVATRLEQLGARHYLVDMGGELRLSGHNPQRQPWQVAIEKPVADAKSAQRVLPLTDCAVSTSGDYRNFFEIDGRRYSHEIDPRTGYPVAHGLVSVTVIADTAMNADAWATALLVLGPEQGPLLAEREALAVLFIQRQAGNVLVERSSTAFASYLSR